MAIRKTFGAETEEKALADALQYKLDMDKNGGPRIITKSNKTLVELITACINESYKLNKIDQSTYKRKTDTLKKISKSPFANKAISKVSRDEVVNYLTPLLENSSNLTETKKIISSNMNSINDIAQSVVSKYSNYKTNISLANSNFPTKQYGKISFPAGNYEALKITIGEGYGNNWWCVMFPPLCFTNSSAGFFDDPSKEKLQASLSAEEYYMVNNYDKPNVKIKFKLLEWWNS